MNSTSLRGMTALQGLPSESLMDFQRQVDISELMGFIFVIDLLI
jgi:hypothetical protein